MHIEEPYYDHKSGIPKNEYKERLKTTSTVWISNLDESTREEQIYALFSKCGKIKRLIMGLYKNPQTPAGFAFVEYFNHEDALLSINMLHLSKLD